MHAMKPLDIPWAFSISTVVRQRRQQLANRQQTSLDEDSVLAYAAYASWSWRMAYSDVQKAP
jgi:predicted membrane-bound mannosyltransferase